MMAHRLEDHDVVEADVTEVRVAKVFNYHGIHLQSDVTLCHTKP